MVRATLRITASRAAHRRATLAEADPSAPTRIPRCAERFGISSSFPAIACRAIAARSRQFARLPHDRRRPPPAGQEAFVTSAGAIGRCADEERPGVRPDKTVTPRRRRIG